MTLTVPCSGSDAGKAVKPEGCAKAKIATMIAKPIGSVTSG